MWFCARKFLYAWNVIINVLCDETRWIRVVAGMEFQGKFMWIVSVCKDVWNPYGLVSWNSNNHSRSDRVEWIMSWGVTGGPSLWTWSSPRRKGDLPLERLGDNSLCLDSIESGNRYRCKPPREKYLKNRKFKNLIIELYKKLRKNKKIQKHFQSILNSK